MESPLGTRTPGATDNRRVPEGDAPPESVGGDEVRACMRVLQAIVADRTLLAHIGHDERRVLLEAANRLTAPTDQEARTLRRAFRRQEKRQQRDRDVAAVAKVGVRALRRAGGLGAPAVRPLSGAAPASGVGESTDDNATELGAGTGCQSEPGELSSARSCYVCKTPYRRLHPFYDSMCTPCGDLSYRKRSQTANLHGRIALITGSRLKIGYQAALMLLRAGATVIATTRFPHDSASRFAREPDFAEFGSRLHVYGLDLRHTPSVELFTRYLATRFDRLDYIINNAAQTVRRPPGFYAHLLAEEERPFAELPPRHQQILRGHDDVAKALGAGERGSAGPRGPSARVAADVATRSRRLASPTTEPQDEGGGAHRANDALGHNDARALPAFEPWQRRAAGAGLWGSARLSQVPYDIEDATLGAEVFPRGQMDSDLQQIDLRTMNSWRLRLADVPTPELLEVHLVNVVAPFVLCSKLKPLLLAHNTRDRHIVNVSAMEGQFQRGTKTDKHPHTNMAKAALNMLTRTSASDYARDGISMNSVDTGWVTDEDPAVIVARKVDELDFEPPLDIVDGAARVLDPIFHGVLTGEHICGKFLKDFRPVPW